MTRERIIQNFVKLEILLICDYLLFAIIFAKEQLSLDDKKSAIFVNLVWLLLQNDNPAYESETGSRRLGQSSRRELPKSKKDLQSDIELFKSHIIPLTVPLDAELDPNPVFSQSQLPMVIKFVYETYIDKFTLFKNVFENKEQNEEIKIMVDISQPIYVPPLKDALYLGYEYQPGE